MHCFIVRSLLSSSALAGTVAAQRSMSTRRSPGVAHEERAKANRTKINLSIGPLSLAQRPYSGFVAWLWWRRGRGAPCLDAWWRVLSALAPTGLTTAALPQRLRGIAASMIVHDRDRCCVVVLQRASAATHEWLQRRCLA